MNLTVRPLRSEERQQVYETRYCRDFHKEERKPAAMIERMLAEGRYACLGFFEGAHLAAYAFLMPTDAGVILDYFAVDSAARGAGFGSAALSLLLGTLEPARPLLVETEDPDFAADEPDLANRLRRIRFYERSGLQLSGVRIDLFGCRYRLMFCGSCDSTDAALRERLKQAYLASMGQEIYNKYIRLPL